MIDLRHLRYFMTMAEELNFTHAAEKLLVTQPTLSESIRELENELGTELFIRSTRHVSLTWPGAILLGETKRILRLLDDAVRLTREAADADAVTLRVGVVENQDPGILSKALARCRHLLPRLRPIIHVLPTALQLRALQHRRIDVGIIFGPATVEGLTVDLLWQEPLAAILPRDHALARLASVTVAQFRDETLILPDSAISPGYRDLLIELCRVGGFEPKATEQTFHLETWLSQVASRFGVAFMPVSIDVSRQPEVAVVPLSDSAAHIPVMAAWRADDASPAMLAFVAALKSSRLASGVAASRASSAPFPPASPPEPLASGQRRDLPP
jgi:DNA-binding transcriptional LysR family regulator